MAYKNWVISQRAKIPNLSNVNWSFSENSGDFLTSSGEVWQIAPPQEIFLTTLKYLQNVKIFYFWAFLGNIYGRLAWFKHRTSFDKIRNNWKKSLLFCDRLSPPQLEVFLSEPRKVIHSGNLELQTTITFDLKVLRRRLKVRWKAEILYFPKMRSIKWFT